MRRYDPKKIEKKWQKAWQRSRLYHTEESAEKKCYVLDMFPYPSGDGLHTGHVRVYTASDIYARYKTMNGFNVLHPTGWDAFGLPAEQYAIANKTHPAKAVAKNVKRFKEQLNSLGFSYDWDREINTTDPSFYKWTQWIFLKLYKKGLAYESFEPINWCPNCQTGLANEDLEDGKCERCGTPVEKRPMRQWVLRITKYAERLLEDIDKLNWTHSSKELQKNWIGRSEGAEIDFRVKDSEAKIKVFTTRPDTLFGATYMVIAPEHPVLKELRPLIKNLLDVEAYIIKAGERTEIERTAIEKNKTGVKLEGVMAMNPANGEELPVFIADYVLANYGTGAIMAVPAHDERDYEFAKKFKLPIREVILGGDVKVAPYIGPGLLVNSAQFNNFPNEKAKQAITEFVNGQKKAGYKLRDWVFSRQRYWGEPIPIIHCGKCGAVPVPERDLPVKLPDVKAYQPTGTGESPLAAISSWVNTECPKCGGKGKRETNTMPQWAGSSWYYIRFIDPQNKKSLVDKKKEKYWSPVDMYVGGAEHVTRHLIYARFWHKFLKDIDVVNYSEPFSELKLVGIVVGEDGRKMSKRWGNIVNSDDVVKTYGADTLRLYEMFMGPFSDSIAWDSKSIIGPRRFLERVWRVFDKVDPKAKPSSNTESVLHESIIKVGSDISEFKFNTAISQLMILFGEFEKEKLISKKTYETFLILLAPFAPHMTEELWHLLGHAGSIHKEKWPKYDPKKLARKKTTIVVQINGKIRGEFEISPGASEENVKNSALKMPATEKWLEGRVPKKVIYVPGKLVSIVV